MKNKIIFLLSIALLLMGLSAFAQEDSSHKKDIMNNSSIHDVIKSLQALQALQDLISNREAELKEICKNDKYCLEYAEFMAFPDEFKYLPGEDFQFLLDMLESLENPKQKLYNEKYEDSLFSLSRQTNLINFEASKLEKLTKFDEIKAYILDMPLPYPSLIKALKKMKATASSQEELDFVDSFIKKYKGKLFPKDYEKFNEAAMVEIINSNHPFCLEFLDINYYNYDNLCILPFPFVIEGKTKVFKPIDIEKVLPKFEKPFYQEKASPFKQNPQIEEEEEEMIFT